VFLLRYCTPIHGASAHAGLASKIGAVLRSSSHWPLQIGFLRMTGRLLKTVRIVPPALWRHLGEQLGVAAPDLA
jgi:hypothetical protein